MITILIILFLFDLIFFLQKYKIENVISTQRLKITSYYEYLLDFLFLVLFIFIYVILLRVLKVFLVKNKVDINLLISKSYDVYIFLILHFNIILLLILIMTAILVTFIFKKIFVQRLKLSFMRLNYYHIRKSEGYFYFYITVSKWQNFFWYWLTIKKLKLHLKSEGIFFFKLNFMILKLIYFFFRYLGLIIILISLVLDLLFNNNILIFFPKVLPFFCLYQTIYIINKFFNDKLDPRCDSCCCDYIYPPSKYNIERIDYILLIELTKYLNKLVV